MPSEKEEKLLNFITNAQTNVTVKLIEEELGKEYLGAIGQLIREGSVERKKIKIDFPSNPYGWKYTKVFVIKKGGENDGKKE